MNEDYIIPNYIKTSPEENFITIKTAGIMESHLSEKLSGLMKKYSHSFQFAFLPHFNGVSFRISKSDLESNIQIVKKEFCKFMAIE